MTETIAYSVLIVSFLILIVIAAQFMIENERYAIKQTLKVSVIYISIILICFLFKISFSWIAGLQVILYSFSLFLFFTPFKFSKVEIKIDKIRIDERTTIFSRMFELKDDGEKFFNFYREYPELKECDDILRELPGLLSPNSLFYNAEYFKKAGEYDKKLSTLIPLVYGKEKPTISNNSVSLIQNEIVKRAKIFGSISVGFTELKDYHFYSKKGRGKLYGKEIIPTHKYAIAFTVEMDKNAVDQAPNAPVVAESIKQYYHAAKIATEIAVYIREMGFGATAHIDANYEVICPLVARDAGLGDIGRMGILMTPKLGPRVRLSVVTTTLEIAPSVKKYSNSIQYFCQICKKCAHTCPSKAIPENNLVKNNFVRYRIDHEKCYGFWAKAGTDCARCMSTCPYSHPDNWFHNLVRFGINRNPYFAKLALYADHFFYGKIPKVKKYLD